MAWSSLVHPVGPVGYAVAHQIAAEQLGLGLDVIVECVNPVGVTRDGWIGTATAAGAAVVEVELLCFDLAVHRGRVETRPSDVEGLVKPTWQEVLSREYKQTPFGTRYGHDGSRTDRRSDRGEHRISKNQNAVVELATARLLMDTAVARLPAAPEPSDDHTSPGQAQTCEYQTE